MSSRLVLSFLLLACVGLAVYQYSLTPARPVLVSPEAGADSETDSPGDSQDSSADPKPAADNLIKQEPAGTTEMATYKKTIITPGNGPTPQPKQYVTVSADLYLANPDGSPGQGIWSTHKPSGFLFPASSGPQPFEYQAGVGGVVPGWEDGVASMQLGEAARLNIPWAYAYGAAGHPGFKIPPKADLVFDITVLGIK